MSDTVWTYLLFPEGFSGHPMREVIERGLAEQWVPSDTKEAFEPADRCWYTVSKQQPERIGDLDRALSEIDASEYATIWMQRERLPFFLSKNSQPDHFAGIPYLELIIPEIEFKWIRYGKRQQEATIENVASLIEVIRLIVRQTAPTYGAGGYRSAVEKLTPDRQNLLDGHVPDLFWLNVFGPHTVDRLGQDRLKSAPAWHVEEMKNGWMILVMTDNPVEPSEKVSEVRDRIKDHIELE